MNMKTDESTTTARRVALVLLVIVVATGTIPILAVAQPGGDAGGTIVVEEGETVDSVNAVAGNVVIYGTVENGVSVAAGNVRIADGGTVGGDVQAFGGNVEIAGTVDGDVTAGGGNVIVAESGSIAGNLEAGAGTIQLNGQIDGDVEVGADRITIGDNAEIGGDLTYSGTLEGNEGAVAGTITEDEGVGPDFAPTLGPLASWVFALYGLVLNLILGAILLALFPRFSRGVADRVATSPVRAGLVGLAILIVVPILLIAIAITVVGIPITVLGLFAFALVSWIGIVYGWFALAAWVLSAAGVDSLWLALVVGLVVGTLLSQLPYVGGLLTLLVLLLGLGALSMGLYGRRRRNRETRAGQGTGPAAD